jgi:hypothetical protein
MTEINNKLSPQNQYVERYGVTGDSGTEYIVSKKSDGTWACSCPGWKFHSPRHDCKHIDRVRFALNFPIGFPAQEPSLDVKCECGVVYSLHTHTVCPRCHAWPKATEPRAEPKPAVPVNLANLRVRKFRVGG